MEVQVLSWAPNTSHALILPYLICQARALGTRLLRFTQQAPRGAAQLLVQDTAHGLCAGGGAHPGKQTLHIARRVVVVGAAAELGQRREDLCQQLVLQARLIGRKQMEEQFHSASITDELTGLFNRRGFFALAEQQCKLADRHKRGMILLYLDLDGMKKINDELGHKEGDRALKDIAHIFRRSLREADIIARIGGDEFAVLLTDTTEPDIEKIIIGHIQNNIQDHNEKEGRQYELLLSIGMSHYNPERPCSIDELMHRADTLMYEDKRLHKIEKDMAPLLDEEKFERRIYKRFRTGDNCWAELDITGTVKVKTISMGGVHLLTPKPLRMNNIYRIRISPSDHEEITLTGIVAWASGKGPGAGKDSVFPYEAGLKFIELSDSLKSSLGKYTETFVTPD